MKINFLNQSHQWKDCLQTGFDTKRLRIRALDRDALIKISKISDDSDLFTFVCGVNSGEDLHRWLKSVYQKRNYLFFSIKVKNVNKVQGGTPIGLLMLNRHFDGKIEIGGWIGVAFQGRGYGAEAVGGLVDFVQRGDKPLQLYAEIQKENVAAIKALKGSGIKERINPCRKNNGKD